MKTKEEAPEEKEEPARLVETSMVVMGARWSRASGRVAIAAMMAMATPAAAQGAPAEDAAEDGAEDAAEDGAEDAAEDGVDAGPTPEQIADARVHYDRGKLYYKAGEFKLALIELRRAYAIAPSYHILFNIGQTQMQLRAYAGAYKAYAQYLEDGGDEIAAERQESVRLELGLLKTRTAFITVYSNTPGAEVRVDGIPIGRAPLVDAMVNVGEHEVSVRFAGRTLSEYVALAGQEHATLHIDLPVEEPRPPAPVLPPAPIIVPVPQLPPRPGVRAEVVAGWAITGGLTAAAIGTGVAALFAQSDLRDLKQTRTTESELDDAAAKALGLSVTTDVLIGAAAVAAGVSLYFTLTGDEDDEGLEATEVTIGPQGLWLRGHF